MSDCKKIPGNKLALNNTYIMRTWNGLTDSSDPTEEVVVFLGYYDRDVSTTIPFMKELDPKRHTCQVKIQNTGEEITLHVDSEGYIWVYKGNRITFYKY